MNDISDYLDFLDEYWEIYGPPPPPPALDPDKWKNIKL
jgi:hypothetical protein